MIILVALGKIYLETRRMVQATSCKDSILKIMHRISGGKVSKLQRTSLHSCVYCPHREDTFRRFARIWSSPGFNLVLETRSRPIINDRDQSEKSRTSLHSDHDWWNFWLLRRKEFWDGSWKSEDFWICAKQRN